MGHNPYVTGRSLLHSISSSCVGPTFVTVFVKVHSSAGGGRSTELLCNKNKKMDILKLKLTHPQLYWNDILDNVWIVTKERRKEMHISCSYF